MLPGTIIIKIMCKPNAPAGIKCPPPSKTISLITRFGTILNTLIERIPTRPTGRSSVFKPGTLRESVLYIGWKIRQNNLRVPPRSEASPPKGGLEGRDRAQERPKERDIEAGAEDAEHRSRTDAEEGKRLLLESELWRHFLLA